LKPETIKCYARQLQRATEIILSSFSRCCCYATPSIECRAAIDTVRMSHCCGILAAFVMSPSHRSRRSSERLAFLSRADATALMTRERRAIANIGFIIRGDAAR
jgi:hypothetical protein